MNLAAAALCGFVAFEHCFFFVLEAFLWQTPYGRKTFGMDAATSATTASLAKNQGTYNLFLAAGLVWSLFAAPEFAQQLRFFFLGCVLVAAVVGAFTASKRILVVQGAPALAALVAVVLARS